MSTMTETDECLMSEKEFESGFPRTLKINDMEFLVNPCSEKNRLVMSVDYPDIDMTFVVSFDDEQALLLAAHIVGVDA